MEPLTGMALSTAGKAGLNLVIQEVGRRLAPDEAQRVRRALVEALVAPHQIPMSRRERLTEKIWPFGGPSDAERAAIQKLEGELSPIDLFRVPPRTEPGQLELVPWRERLAETLRQHAAGSDGDETERSAWRALVRGQPPEIWAREVALRFEAALRHDPELRFLLACLEWGDQQAATFALVTSADKMQGALWRIAAVLTLFATGLTIAGDQLVHLA
jgi:hypothetical protein